MATAASHPTTPRLPNWSRDELILALELYLRPGRASYSPSTPEVIALSQELRGLGLFPDEVRSNQRFRNPQGVALKLHNFESIDPAHSGAGMAHGAAGDQQVWDEWAGRPDELRRVAGAIRAASGWSPITVLDETGEAEEYEAEEGRILYRLHRRYERDRKLVKRKKEEAFQRAGRLACEVCDFESSEVFGPGVDVIDVHHVVPLHKVGRSTTRMSDLALLCPTCHRAVHAHRPFITPRQLRERRQSRIATSA